MSNIYANDNEETSYVAELLLELEYAQEQRELYDCEHEQHFWANAAIEEINIELELLRLA